MTFPSQCTLCVLFYACSVLSSHRGGALQIFIISSIMTIIQISRQRDKK